MRILNAIDERRVKKRKTRKWNKSARGGGEEDERDEEEEEEMRDNEEQEEDEKATENEVGNWKRRGGDRERGSGGCRTIEMVG